MVQPRTWVKVADNTGAKVAAVFKVLGGSKKHYAKLGDVVVVSIKSAAPRGNVKRKSVQRGVLVRTKHLIRRKDGSAIRFDENAIVIIDKEKEPKGTRVFGPVARELREMGYEKIVSLASEVL